MMLRSMLAPVAVGVLAFSALAGCAAGSPVESPTPSPSTDRESSRLGDDALTAREAWLGCMGASQAVMWSNGTLLTWETWPVFTEDAVELQPDGVLRVTIVVENSGPRRFVTSTCNVTGTLDAPTIFWQGFEYSE